MAKANNISDIIEVLKNCLRLEKYTHYEDGKKEIVGAIEKLKDMQGKELADGELNPCPFCGGVADLENGFSLEGYHYHPYCTNCGIGKGADTIYTKTEAIKIWNKRVVE